MFEDQDKLERVSAADVAARISATPGPLLVMFTAAWCTPCAAAETVLCQIADEFAGRVDVWAVDHAAATEVAATRAIRQLPCVLLYHGCVEIERFTGLPSKQELTARLTTLVHGHRA